MPPKSLLKSHALAAALLFAFAVSFCSVAAAQTGEPSREPVLRVETGMHTAAIRRIGVDAANRYLVTASDDKTVRVWELPSGRLLRVIRVPIGAGSEGKLYTVAISPDGSTIAAGGWTGHEWEKTYSLYLFDRASGRLVRRLGGLPSVAMHLVYSLDGRFLAATLGDGTGVRVYSTAAYAQAGEDRDYGGHSLWADFDRAGRLATTSDDGFIRLYATGRDGSLRLLAKQSAAGGKLPRGVSFSPDGTRLAVGFQDSTNVGVFSTRDLSPLYAPDTRGRATAFPDGRGGTLTTRQLVHGNFSKVAWSADGVTLYAGGEYSDVLTEYDAKTLKFIRAWSDGGRGSYRDIVVEATNSIMHIVPLLGGGLVYGASGPSFGVIDTSDRRAFVTEMAVANHRGLGAGLLLSPDGMGIQFGYEQNRNSPARFSLADRKLEVAPFAGDGWRAPITESASIRLTYIYERYGPLINGTQLHRNESGTKYGLSDDETRRSFSIAPDGERFLLGTDWNIRLYDRSGQELWRLSAPGAAYAVNISSDGRLAVAAYGDGTIRWYRMTDGKELLAFFPHADRKRWMLWTPSGYYDASPGAEELIGWHVNNGKDAAADFFPVGQFRSVYYRPDVVSKILQAGDEQLALREANEEAGRKQQQTEVAQLLPPVVEVVSPMDGTEITTNEIVVRYNVRTPSGDPVTEVRALVNGRPANAERGLLLKSTGTVATDARELRISVPEGESQVSVIAANRFTTSVPATVRVRARKTAASSTVSTVGSAASNGATSGAFEIKPKLYVLAVGVSNYADPKLKLGFPAKDASDFAAAMERQKGGLYRDVVVRLLTDEKATKDNILDGLDWIRKETTSKDVAMVLFAGHGVNDQNGRYFYLPHNTDLEKLLRTGVSFEDIKNTVSALAGKTLFFIDTCHSGNVLGTRRALNFDIVGVVNELSSAENGAVVFAASTGNQYSLENVAWNNGAFTLAVVEGFGGRADYSGKGRITINMLDLYISERVKELTKGQQTPTTAKPQTVPDFPVALKK